MSKIKYLGPWDQLGYTYKGKIVYYNKDEVYDLLEAQAKEMVDSNSNFVFSDDRETKSTKEDS